MSSKGRLSVTLAVVLFGIMLTGCAHSTVEKDLYTVTEATINIKLQNIWQGTCSQTGYSGYPMIMFISDQRGNTFKGVNWYPNCDLSRYYGGLISFSGKIGPGSAVRFNEGKVISGSVIGGCKYTGTIEGDTLRGRWRGGLIVGKILLKSGFSSTNTLKSSDPFEVNSIWKGTCDQPGYKPYPMILFINQRKDKAIEGITWYPKYPLSKYGSGLIRFTGQIGPENTVSFEERDVIHGNVPGGCKYTATFEKGALKGSWDRVSIKSGKVVKGNILLKRAD